MSNERVKFSETKDYLDIPNLIEHQLESFNKFINDYIGQVLDQIFPIKDKEENNSYELEYVKYWVEPPKITPKEAKRKNKTYAGDLMLRVRLHDRIMGGVIKESDVFYGEIPYMTENGSFISNGNESVVVTQIVKSPGIYFNSEINDRGKTLYNLVIQPDRGSWLYMETDARDEAWVRIDKGRKVLLTVFLKALGFKDNAEIEKVFGKDNKYIQATLKKDDTATEEEAIKELYQKTRPGDPQLLDRAKQMLDNLFFNERRYDLEDVGRSKMNRKLGIKQRSIRNLLGEDTGPFKSGTMINDDVLDTLEELELSELVVETKERDKVKIIGNEAPTSRTLTKGDIVAAVNYLINLDKGIGDIDDIDHLSNRYLRLVGKIFQKEFSIGMRRVEKNIKDRLIMNASGHRRNAQELTPENLTFTRPMEAKFREFLGSSQLSQYVDQINPLSEISNKRRVTAIGPGGFTKERAGVDVRDVNSTHYGRICPIETPEGSSVGLISQLSSYAEINDYGFIVTPYRRVRNSKATEEVVRLSADEEEKYYLADASSVDEEGNFIKNQVLVKYGENYLVADKTEVDYVGVSTKQPFGVGACSIPFLENDDASRALMGANMMRQGLPTVNPEEPIIGTGLERKVAKDSGASIFAKEDGVVTKIADECIEVTNEYGAVKKYDFEKFYRTNDSTCWNHFVKCYVGKEVKKGEVLADSTNTNNGELAVGKNVTVAFMPFDGFNFEDSIILSDRLVKDDTFSVVMIEEYKVNVRRTRVGEEEITRDIPYVGEKQKKNLDENGIVRVGSYVKGGDILVGKRTPRLREDKSPEDRLIESLYIGKSDDFRDNSLVLDYGQPEKIVIDVVRNTNKDTNLKKGILEEIKVYVAEKRKISVGDKMAGRHGNKGVVSVILPEEDMPHLEDGTPVDVILNPLGVPSRMNIGQIMEVHLGMLAKVLGVKFEVPVFSGIDSKKKIKEMLVENDLPEDGKFRLIDGRTGEYFKNKITVGVMYMLKLDHQVVDKRHERSTGPYSLITQQPLGGKAQNGGQRFGEMEVWALEAYGAANLLQEMLTIKSDDFVGRTKMHEALINGQSLPEPNLTESLKLLLYEMRSLGLDTDIITDNNRELLKPRYKPEWITLESEIEDEEYDDFEPSDDELIEEEDEDLEEEENLEDVDSENEE